MHFFRLHFSGEQLLQLRELLRILLGKKLLCLRKLYMLQRIRKLRFIKKYVDCYLSVCKGIPGKDILAILSAVYFVIIIMDWDLDKKVRSLI